MTLKTLKIGTRGSPLALKQADMLVRHLKRAHPDMECETVIIKTSGDWKPQDGETPLPEDKGGKGQFAKEIENAILAGAIDCGVHSVKDMPAFLTDGLQMEHYLPRSDPRDALLAQSAASTASFDDIPQGAVVGTCSPRRAALILHVRPDLKITPLRGNVHTRIMKLCAGQVDATLLAMAGLTRLGLGQGVEHGKVCAIPVDVMLPACGQGAIGVEFKQGRKDLGAVFDTITCRETTSRVGAEREVLKILNGSCQTPIAAHAVFEGGRMQLRALVASLDGVQLFEHSDHEDMDVNDVTRARELGARVGQALRSVTPPELLTQ